MGSATPGNLYEYEKKELAKSAIRKCMKMHGMKVDGLGRATRKFLKTGADATSAK
jgi:hypothetical protein